MPDIKRILVPVDFSDATKPVAEYACILAKALGARLTALYVVPAMSQYVQLYVPSTNIDLFVNQIYEGARQSMEEFLEDGFCVDLVDGEVATGYAPEKILEMADSLKADLIVMGSHGRKGIDHILFGSVAEKVVKSAKIPVLVVRTSGMGSSARG